MAWGERAEARRGGHGAVREMLEGECSRKLSLFRIVHGSGIEVCSAAACWCYCAPNSTWSLMIKACKSGRTVWTEAVSTELGAIARKWQQTKVNDSVRNDPAMHALSQH